MGVYTDLASTNPIPSAPRVGLDRSSAQQLLNQAVIYDPDVRTAFAARDEIAVIPEQTDAGVADTYTLTINFYGALKGTAITTAAIAFDAVDTAIESAIDTAAAAIPGFVAGDIAVTMAGAAGLDDGTVTLTFSGDSVDETPAVVTLTPTGFTATGPITRTEGRTNRKALQALYDLNVISGTVVESPNAPTDWIRPASVGQTRPRFQLIRDLALQATIEDGTDYIYNAVVALYPLV